MSATGDLMYLPPLMLISIMTIIMIVSVLLWCSSNVLCMLYQQSIHYLLWVMLVFICIASEMSTCVVGLLVVYDY